MHRWSEDEIAEFCSIDAWETGQEDLPSAYRYCPMSMQESLGCVVVWFHDEWQVPAYQVYSGLLQLLHSADFLDCWKRSRGGFARCLCPSALTTPRSQMFALQKGQANGP